MLRGKREDDWEKMVVLLEEFRHEDAVGCLCAQWRGMILVSGVVFVLVLSSLVFPSLKLVVVSPLHGTLVVVAPAWDSGGVCFLSRPLVAVFTFSNRCMNLSWLLS